MDQDAFRQMLSTSSTSSSSSQPRSRFGQAPPKRPQPTAADKGASTDFKPRKAAFKPKKAPDGSVYRDRAAERRQGKDGDFAEAEKLLDDFKTRSEREEVDRETFEKQMQYLGGDAQHSILVKGLDMALLERMKHEQAKQADAALGDVEDELDRALEAGPSTAASPPAEVPKKTGGKGGKKTRDELIAEMKALRSGGGGGAGAAEKDLRFKPLGGAGDAKGKGRESAAAAAPLGSGWKKVAAAPMEEKKRRKKKKVVPPEDAPPSVAAAEPASSSAAPPPLPPAPAAAAANDDNDDDDDDIFGGAGDYKGLDSDSDDDDAAPSSAAPPLPPAAAPPAAGEKRKYFDDDDDPSEPISTAPSAVSDLAAKQAAANAAAASSRGEAGAGAERGEEDGEVPMRLQGLSGQGPSVREMLEMDKAAEEEEKRKAKKAKYAAKGAEKKELKERNMTDADRANKEYLEMQQYLAKKEKGGGGDE